jgi:hypothetical protein
MVIPAFSSLPAVLFPCSCSTASLAALKRLLRTISSHQFQALSKYFLFLGHAFLVLVCTAVSPFAILSSLVFFRFLSRIRSAPFSCSILLHQTPVCLCRPAIAIAFRLFSPKLLHRARKHSTSPVVSIRQAHFPYDFNLLRFYSAYLLKSFGGSSLNPRIE